VRDYPGPGDLNERIERAFFAREREEEKARLKKKALREIQSRQNGARSRLDALRRRRESTPDPARLRELGDLLKSALHSIPSGERWVTLKDYYNENAPVEIELDARLSPVENAESYYRRYKRAHRTSERLEEEIRSLELTLGELETREARLIRETELEALRRAAPSAAAAPRTEASPPGLLFATGSYHFLVGRTSAENDLLLRHHVKGNDYWFHVRDFPGAYVFVKSIKKGASRSKTVPLEAMLDAGNLALFYSKARSSGQADVYYTQVKYLRRAREARRGTVIPTQERNLFIKAEPERIERLKGSRVV
jgi:predicted ribosome quality control (RQC) complex YloA/Tae2 family protein